MLRYGLVLTVALVAIWLGLSGYFKPMLLSLGAISVGLVLFLCARMGIIDRQTAPYMTTPQTLVYFFWLFGEIVKANVQVVKAVLSPDLNISPTLTKIPLPNDAELSKTMFANSITLTPGTVSVEIEEDHILVHALLEEMSQPADFNEMALRSVWAVGETN